MQLLADFVEARTNTVITGHIQSNSNDPIAVLQGRFNPPHAFFGVAACENKKACLMKALHSPISKSSLEIAACYLEFEKSVSLKEKRRGDR